MSWLRFPLQTKDGQHTANQSPNVKLFNTLKFSCIRLQNALDKTKKVKMETVYINTDG